MRMVKQRPITDGTIAIDCGVCPVAMLTDLPYEKMLADIPHYHATSHHDWMRYFNLLTLLSFFNPKANPRCVRLLVIIKYLAVPNSLGSCCKYLMSPF